MRTPIFGGFDVSRSSNASDNRIVNLFPSLIETRSGKDVGALYLCPGLDLVATLSDAPVQALYAWRNALYAFAGQTAFKIDSLYNVTTLGSSIGGPEAAGYKIDAAGNFGGFVLPFSAVGDGGVEFVDNGLQLGMFVSASATQLDSFMFLSQPSTYQFWQSNELDLAGWPGDQFASASGDPDNIVAIRQVRRELYVIKESHTEIWINAGTSPFIAARLEGAYIDAGCLARRSVADSGELLFWLAKTQNGQPYVLMLHGYTPIRISTHALEYQLASYSSLSDAVGYCYQQEGHSFYVLTLPSGNATWCYEITDSVEANVRLWHQRAGFSSGLFTRHYSNCHASFNGAPHIGDYRNGNIYKYNLDTLTDNGEQRKWLRSWRALVKPSEQPQRFSQLRIDMQTGIGIPDGGDPQSELRWSDDGGHLWSQPRIGALGETGQTARRVLFNRLGSTRRNSGLDRIFELSGSDQAPVAITAADLT